MIVSIDHVVITTTNLEKLIHFYTKILEMELKKEFFKENNSTMYSLHFGNQKINIHEIDKIFSPHAHQVYAGSLDLCFISEKKISYWQNKFKKHGVKIIDGPVKRSGAIKNLLSIYIRDPDLNLIEISNYIVLNA